jgi:hypothetical protein
MQLLLINKNGEPVQISLPSWKIRLVIVAVVALCSGLIASGFMLRQSSIVDAAVIENWRMKIQEQDAVVEELQTDSVARRQAVGRQIADMQARLWRMEALASYMHESSGFTSGRIRFRRAGVTRWSDKPRSRSAERTEFRLKASELV